MGSKYAINTSTPVLDRVSWVGVDRGIFGQIFPSDETLSKFTPNEKQNPEFMTKFGDFDQINKVSRD